MTAAGAVPQQLRTLTTPFRQAKVSMQTTSNDFSATTAEQPHSGAFLRRAVTATKPNDERTRDHARLATKSNDLPQYPPLGQVTKPTLTTNELAYYLNRRPNTLRDWSCKSGTGPMTPARICGILAWSTAEAKALLGLAP